MFKFTKTGLFVLSNIIIFFIVQIFIYQYPIKIELKEEIMNYDKIPELPVNNTAEKPQIWTIEIPKISLIGNIAEGTTSNVLKQNIGHFEITSKREGNIGLAAYNKGNNVNYFEKLKLLKKEDEIKYRYNDFVKIYEVKKNRIIKSTEWEFLEETEENMLTLITYVENQPEYRRCIQAIEKTPI